MGCDLVLLQLYRTRLVHGGLKAMNHLTLRITCPRPGVPLLLASVLVLFLCGAAVTKHPESAQAAVATTYIPRGAGRHFYVSSSNYPTTTVKTACASGYHMASLWELYDVSNLTYDYDHPAARTQADSGYGPPSYWYGWVRTGYNSSGDSTTGTGNCLNWSNTDSGYYGVSVRLSRTWETAPGDMGPWDATSFPCNSTGPVWCVGDFYAVYLPMVLRDF